MVLAGWLACVPAPPVLPAEEEVAASCAGVWADADDVARGPEDGLLTTSTEEEAGVEFHSIRGTSGDVSFALTSPEPTVAVTATLASDGVIVADSPVAYLTLADWSAATCEGFGVVRVFVDDPLDVCPLEGGTADLHLEVTALESGEAWTFVQEVSVALAPDTTLLYCE